MMVLFVSRSDKKALLTVRRVLDSFADRIGNDTWKTVITKEGLLTVRMMLRQQATKSMAVACHWLRSRTHSELLWIVGNRDRFNAVGIVPVNSTHKNIVHSEWEGQWQYMPLLKSLAAVAALLHDWGKASNLFQAKLQTALSGRQPAADALRHEWISCKLLEAVVKCSGDSSDDKGWIECLMADGQETGDLLAVLQENIAAGKTNVLSRSLPPAASVLMWLILAHHRLPLPNDQRFDNDEPRSFAAMMQKISADWSYANPANVKLADCYKFTQGLLLEDAPWHKQLQQWLPRLQEALPALLRLWAEPADDNALRPLLIYAREALMLSDHYVSSLQEDIAKDQTVKCIWANTIKDKNENNKWKYHQTLTQHLMKTASQAVKIVRRLPSFAKEMEQARDIKFVHTGPSSPYYWQEKAVMGIKRIRQEQGGDCACFIVNMASTGKGKTLANARIMQALSEDEHSLRYVLALGLRTLTLQTGTEYRERIAGLEEDDLAVLIGSSAVSDLYDKAHEHDSGSKREEECIVEHECVGAAAEPLLADEIHFQDAFSHDQIAFMDIFMHGKVKEAKRNRAFLYRPVLVTTIDNIMNATESKRGGRNLLPFLRLLSSDIVIDEIDDFGPRDLTAIARLVHLAGMLGRNVVISSATVPPDLATCLCRAFHDGLLCYNRFFAADRKLQTFFVDEFRTMGRAVDFHMLEEYTALQQKFLKWRVRSLWKEPVRRRAVLVPCPERAGISVQEAFQIYGRYIQQAAIHLHENNHIIDKNTGKRISFGVIRLANIRPCVAVSRYLLQCSWPAGIEPRIMCYHSAQVLLLRHEQEQYLDKVLKRKGEMEQTVNVEDPILRQHIDASQGEDIMFIVVATPVEEIGRDHDFDWAVIEPSSYRSIIQLAGRVLRHRAWAVVEEPNVAVMQYNLRAWQKKKPAFVRPGFETKQHQMDSYDMYHLVDAEALRERVDAVPRICRAAVLHPEKKLIDLEQAAMAELRSLEKKGPDTVGGWQQTFWWLTAEPQQLNRFRASSGEDIELCYEYNEGKLRFCAKENDWNSIGETLGISLLEAPTEQVQQRYWLVRDYAAALRKYMETDEFVDERAAMKAASHRYGEIILTNYRDGGKYFYSDQLGLFRMETGEL